MTASADSIAKNETSRIPAYLKQIKEFRDALVSKQKRVARKRAVKADADEALQKATQQREDLQSMKKSCFLLIHVRCSAART